MTPRVKNALGILLTALATWFNGHLNTQDAQHDAETNRAAAMAYVAMIAPPDAIEANGKRYVLEQPKPMVVVRKVVMAKVPAHAIPAIPPELPQVDLGVSKPEPAQPEPEDAALTKLIESVQAE